MSNLIPYSNGRSGMPSLLGWDPTRLISDLFSWNPFGGETVWSAMPIHVKRDEDNVHLSVDLPGVDAKDVDITFERGALTIVAQRGEQSYRYSVQLGDEVDPASIEASLDKGVLTMKVAKRPEAKPRKIALSGAEAKRLEDGEGGSTK
jgi:HSP20 family protein